MSFPSLHVQGEATQVIGLCHDHALGAALGHHEIGSDRVGAVVDPGDHPGQYVLDVAAELERRLLIDRRHHAEERGQRGQ